MKQYIWMLSDCWEKWEPGGTSELMINFMELDPSTKTDMGFQERKLELKLLR